MARYKAYQRDAVYRMYVTSSLQNIPQNRYITATYEDMIKPKPHIEEGQAEQFAADFIRRHKLTFESEVST